MTITQIKYFIEVVKCGSLQKAADNLFISRQALSKQIRSIENELGVTLFDYAGKKQILSDAGRILSEAWTNILNEYDESVQNALRAGNIQEGKLVIGVQEDIRWIRHKAMYAARKFKEKHGDTDIELRMGSPDEIIGLFKQGKVDMAIMLTLSMGFPKSFPYMIISRHPVRPVIAVSKENPLSEKEHLEMKDLENETFILMSNEFSDMVGKRQKRDLKSNGINPARIIYAKNPNEIEAALIMNQGITLIHEMLLTDIKDKIKTFDFTAAVGNEEFCTIMVWNEEKYKSIVKKMVELIKES